MEDKRLLTRLLNENLCRGNDIYNKGIVYKIDGGRYWARTSDPRLVRAMLSQLS